MGALGILAALGGAGRGYMAGEQFTADQKAQAVRTALLQQQQQENQTNLDIQQQMKDAAAQDAADQANAPDPNATLKAQKASVLNSQSADQSGLANVAAAPGTTGPVDQTAANLVSQANAPAPDPTAGTGIAGSGTAFDMTQGKNLVSPEPATVASPTAGIPPRPTAGSPVDLSASPGIRMLPANVPSAADSYVPMHDSILDASNTFQRMAPKFAAIALQGGRPEMAVAINKLATDSRANTYTTMWQNTLRVLSTGNDQAAATAIGNLYNLGFPDDKHVDIQPLGNGQFKVVQYDTNTGKMIDGGVINRQTMLQLGETTLNPAEWAKLQIERENTAKTLEGQRLQFLRGERHDQSQEAINAARDARSEANMAAMITAGRWAPKTGDGGAKADAAAEKTANQQAGQARLAVSKNKLVPPEGQSEAQAAAEGYVKAQAMDPAAAADLAANDYSNKRAAASAAVNDHMQYIHGKDLNVWNDATVYREYGAPAIVKAAAAMAPDNKVTESNYRKAAMNAAMKGATLGQKAAAVAAPPPPSRASTSTSPGPAPIIWSTMTPPTPQ